MKATHIFGVKLTAVFLTVLFSFLAMFGLWTTVGMVNDMYYNYGPILQDNLQRYHASMAEYGFNMYHIIVVDLYPYRYAVPIAAAALTVSIVNFFDTAVCLPLIRNLPYGEIVNSFKDASFMGADEISMYLFGIWQGMALTVFNLVPAVLASVGTACLPVMTKAQGLKDKTGLNRQSEKLFRITAFVSVPAAVFIFLFRREIIVFLFGITQGQAQIGAELLAMVIPFCPLACFVSAFNSVIHAHGKSAAVFKILVAASAAKCTVSAIGCSLPQVNIRAMAMSAAVFYTIIFVLSALYISKLGVRIHFFRIFVLPLTASALTALALNIFRHKILFCLPLFLQLLFGGIVFCTAYILVMFVLGFTVDI